MNSSQAFSPSAVSMASLCRPAAGPWVLRYDLLLVVLGRGAGAGPLPAGRSLPLRGYKPRRGEIKWDAERLTAYARAIDMIGRDRAREALLDWLGGAPPIAVRVLTGPAGTGNWRPP